jgi:glycosyltransferase involved in cell wall biosynthesis
MTPDITIVVPAYNRRDYLGLALRSALDQTFQNLEVIVVDDGSTDNSMEVVEQIQKTDPRVRIFVHQKNRGPSAAINTGILNAKSRYITFLGSDDLFAPERCQVLCSSLDAEQEPCVVYSDLIDVDTAQTRIIPRLSTASYRPEGMVFAHILAGSFHFEGGPIALPKSCFDEVGLFDETLRWCIDIDMALRLSAKFPFRFERLSTYGYRSHQGNSRIVMDKVQRMKYESRILERHLLDNLGTLDSNTRRKAFNRLFGCYIGSGQWRKLIRTSFVDWQALISMLTIPKRMNRLNPTVTRS